MYWFRGRPVMGAMYSQLLVSQGGALGSNGLDQATLHAQETFATIWNKTYAQQVLKNAL